MKKTFTIIAVLALSLGLLASPTATQEGDAGGGALNPTTERTKQYNLAEAKVNEALKDLGTWNTDAARFMRWVATGIQTDVAALDWSHAGQYMAKMNEARAIVHDDVRNSGVVSRVLGDIDAANVYITHVIVGPTPQAAIDHAYQLVFEAHEGGGNRIHHPCDGNEAGDPGDRCRASYQDIYDKTQQADELMHYDVMALHTWDKNQTVHHAFVSALYWAQQTTLCMCDADDGSIEHTVYQLGILRDVLDSLRTKPSSVGFSGSYTDARTEALSNLRSARVALDDVGAWVISDHGDEVLAIRVANKIGDAVKVLDAEDTGWQEQGTRLTNAALTAATALQTDIDNNPDDAAVRDDINVVVTHLTAAIKVLSN